MALIREGLSFTPLQKCPRRSSLPALLPSHESKQLNKFISSTDCNIHNFLSAQLRFGWRSWSASGCHSGSLRPPLHESGALSHSIFSKWDLSHRIFVHYLGLVCGHRACPRTWSIAQSSCSWSLVHHIFHLLDLHFLATSCERVIHLW